MEDTNDVVEIFEFVKKKFELVRGLLVEHLSDFLRVKLLGILSGEAIHEFLELGVDLLAKHILDHSLDILVIDLLGVNKLAPFLVVELAPVVKLLDALGHLSPDVVEIEIVGDLDVLLLDDGLLKGEPVTVVTEGERDLNDGILRGDCDLLDNFLNRLLGL